MNWSTIVNSMMGLIVFVSLGYAVRILWTAYSTATSKDEPIIEKVNVGKIILDIEFKDGTIWKDYQTFEGHAARTYARSAGFGKNWWKWREIHASTVACDWINSLEVNEFFFENVAGEGLAYPFHEVFKFHCRKEDHFIDLNLETWKE